MNKSAFYIFQGTDFVMKKISNLPLPYYTIWVSTPDESLNQPPHTLKHAVGLGHTQTLTHGKEWDPQ